MSHNGISGQKTTAGNFAEKAAYFEKKLKELRAIHEKRISLGMSRELSNEALASELAKVDEEIQKFLESVEYEHGTGPEDYYHRSGNDTLASSFLGPLAKRLDLGDHPKDGDYLTIYCGINPRTGKAFLGEDRLNQLQKSIKAAQGRQKFKSKAKVLSADELDQLEKDADEKIYNDPVMGFSTCVSLQKAFSIFWGQASDEERKILIECFTEAQEEAFDHLHEMGFIRGREGHGGAKTVLGEALCLNYAHCSSRVEDGYEYPDPNIHGHGEIPNFVRTKEGKFLTLDAGPLYKSQKYYGATVDISFYQKIKQKLPALAAATKVDWTGHGLNLNEQTVSKDMVREFSKRGNRINAEKKKLATSGQAGAEAIARNTRNTKDFKAGEDWDNYLRAVIGKIDLKRTSEYDLKAPTLLQLRRMVFRGESVIDEYALLFAAANLTITRGKISDVPVTRDAIIKQLGLIEIPQSPDEEGRTPAKKFTTRELIGLEMDCLKMVYAGLDDPRWKVEREFVDRKIDAYEKARQSKQKPGEDPFRLTDEQRQAVYDLTKEGQFIFLKGAAGVGKTASLAPTFRIYEEIFEEKGFRIIGIAPGNKQHGELGKSTEIKTQTAHALLIKHQEATALKAEGKPYKKENLIGRGDIVVCDEAGMLDTYMTHHLLLACHQVGARLIPVGDKNQHGAVETAAMFGLLTTAVGDRCAKIETIARQVDQYKPTAQALFEGKPRVALDYMKRDGQIKVFADGVNEADELVADLFEDMKTGLPGKDKVVRELDWKDVLVLADTNNQVRSLNEKIRAERLARGQLSSEGSVSIETEVATGERFTIRVTTGDRLLLRKNAKDSESQNIYNGDLGTVIGIDEVTLHSDGETTEDIGLTVICDDGKTVKIYASEYEALQYGYAMTGHKAQGMTNMKAYSIEPSSLESLYVNYTRGIHGANIYVNSCNWTQFLKNTEKFKPKQNAIELLPGVQEAIRASAQSGVTLPVTPQTSSVIDSLNDTSALFEFPVLSNESSPSDLKQAEEKRVEQKVNLIPPTEADIELSKTYGHAQYDMREDGQTWPENATHVDVIVPDNPPLGADAGDWKNPGSEVPAEQRRDFCETLQGMTPALITTRYRFIKPTPQEATHERRLHSPADPRRGNEPADRTEPGRAADLGNRADLGSGEPSGRVADRARGFGVYRLADGADRVQRDPAKHTQHRADGFGELDPLAAGGGTPRDSLRQVPSRDLAAAGERRAEGVLPDHSDVRGRSTAELRRTGTGKPAAAAVKPMPFDKRADRELIANLRHRADLPAYAEKLGMELDKKASYKGHLVFRSGGDKIDTYRAPDGTWRWHERDSKDNGDIFALHMRITREPFAEAKEAVAKFEGSARKMTSEELAESTRQAKAKQEAESADRQAKIAAGTQKAQRTLGLMGRRDTRYLESRGISPEVLAETRWKTNIHGSAVFPHHDADRNIAGYEYRGYEYKDKKTGELKEAKGFTTDTEKGIYIANGRCANPTEIRFCESGVDTLSVYQLASPEERQRILFVGTTGETGPNTEAAIKALAERNNIKNFSMAFDRDEGGDKLTPKREQRLREAFPDAQIRDVRVELGMQQGEDPNDLLRRIQAERTQQQEQTRSAADNRTQPVSPTREANQDNPSIQDGKPQQQPEQTKPEPAHQAEPEQNHDQYQDRGMSR